MNDLLAAAPVQTNQPEYTVSELTLEDQLVIWQFSIRFSKFVPVAF
jgi:hypothetical protein